MPKKPTPKKPAPTVAAPRIGYPAAELTKQHYDLRAHQRIADAMPGRGWYLTTPSRGM